MTITTTFPAESGHWYNKAGDPVYEVPKAKGNGMRPTNIRDARKLDLVPSVTLILKEMAKPGLEAWKLQQLLLASMTLSRDPQESEEAYVKRVMEDSRATAEAARERGTILHGAIEQHIRGETVSPEWVEHCDAIANTLSKGYGIDILKAEAEKTFATTSYGGKIDAHHMEDCWLVDFKSKDVLDLKKKLAYPEHSMQLSAYSRGLNLPLDKVRAFSVFIGVNDCQVAVHEWDYPTLKKSLKMFLSVLDYWRLSHDISG